MAEVLKKVDVVTVGAGWTGGIVAAELTKAGLNVLSLERGHMQSTENFNFIHDEWRYGINYGLMQDCSKDTVTFRHDPSGLALPYRKMGSFYWVIMLAVQGCIGMVGLLGLCLMILKFKP